MTTDDASPESSPSCTATRLLDCCLFFTANALARTITRLGEQKFAPVGMTPSYAFLLMLAVERPGISQKELAEELHLAPSTVSRFVEGLVRRGLLARTGEGRNVLLTATGEGEALIPEIRKAWQALHREYSEVLGESPGRELTRLTAEACRALEERD
ncbi:MarR family winged helix-turn-helix transcriptional regulator [Paucidesulfovibrio longus]|uniref:MarR family winged helix-turn-helix transcriptional regulator n=1 Tax=Paucidesulfovibrio longus TaxID=889 RepID=UPI0003B5BA7B|nr:MarR family transcriptional regulator [Paucidesulfovibrio longus]